MTANTGGTVRACVVPDKEQMGLACEDETSPHFPTGTGQVTFMLLSLLQGQSSSPLPLPPCCPSCKARKASSSVRSSPM